MHRHQVALDQVRLARRLHADGDVGLAHGEVELAILQQQVDLDIRVVLEESPSTGASQDEPKAGVAVTLSWPSGRSLLSVSSASVIASLANTSRTVR